jgi:hypothetical protein
MRSDRFERIRERLLRGGVAPRQVHRTILELEDHFTDLVTELQAAGHSREESESQAATRLGSDDVFVASVLAHPELRSKARRWPWLAFGVLPLATFVVLFALSLVLLAEVFEFSEHALGAMPTNSPTLYWVRAVLEANALWLTPVIAAALACFEAARRRAPTVWPLIGTILIALLGAMTQVSLDWSAATPRGDLSAGLGLHFATILTTVFRATVTISAVLIPYFWWRRTHESSGGER